MGKNIDNHSHNNQQQEDISQALSGFLALKTPEFAACFKAYKEFARTASPNSPEFFTQMRAFIAKTLALPESNKSFDAVLDSITKSFISKIATASDGSVFFLDDVPSTSDSAGDNSPRLAYLTEKDLETFELLTSQDPQVTPYLKRLLLALIIYYRRNFHHSGWVRYAREEIFFLASLQDMPPKTKEELTQHLFQEYGFALRVIGSNNPIPCYKIDWLFEQPASESICVGPYLPETVNKLLLESMIIISKKEEED